MIQIKINEAQKVLTANTYTLDGMDTETSQPVQANHIGTGTHGGEQQSFAIRHRTSRVVNGPITTRKR